MIGRGNGRVHECVVVDISTQKDLCETTGALPVANIDELIPALRRVIAWTKRNQAAIVSAVDAHRLWELNGDGKPQHCVDGTTGQKKLDFTVLPSRIRIEADNTLALPADVFRYYQQVVFPKRTDDLLANPKADRLLTQLPTREFIIFGNTVEGAVKSLSLGLLARGKQVKVVMDACGHWNKALAELAIRQMVAKGAQIITVEDLLARRLSRRMRYPSSIFRLGGKVQRNAQANGNGKSNSHSDAMDKNNGEWTSLSDFGLDATINRLDDDGPYAPGSGDNGL